ncbi:MAG: nicotinate (nicotinamide) nucleotide adenylyltransferase [Bacilli bacterium]|nr:nicotinate (nicotinamide) nucleotide adenylyltransferase [Bacilli bacterium]
MAKIIFGGAFDPIHLGHTNMAELASKQFNADVIFVPAKIAIWKEQSVDSKHKLKMIELAVKGHKNFVIDDFEIKSEGVCYTIDTLRHFLKKYPNEKLYLLIGVDQVNKFDAWKCADEISNIAQIIYYSRPRYKANAKIVSKYNMQPINGAGIDISSSDIRSLKDIALDEEVIKYIEKNNLYYIPRVKSYLSESRFNHCVSVAHLAYKIALTNKLENSGSYYIAGLLHDIGKDISDEQKNTIMNAYFKEYVSFGKWSYHQFVGSYLAKNDFKITSTSILNAIMFHATGSDSMDILAKVIYASDKIEPSRGFDSSDLIKSMMQNPEIGFLTVLNANKIFLTSQNKDIYNNLTYKCFKKYLG